MTSDRQVVDANGCKDALERVARDVTERAQRQMIRNHYENERRGAREEARQEVQRGTLRCQRCFRREARRERQEPRRGENGGVAGGGNEVEDGRFGFGLRLGDGVDENAVEEADDKRVERDATSGCDSP